MNPLYAVVAERAGHRCEYCHAPEAVFNFPFEVEHVIPPLLGGSDDEVNLALACRSYNVFKGSVIVAVDSDTATEVALFHPRKDNWNLHFRIEPETGAITGLSPQGRTTAIQLRMNSNTQLAARRQWIVLDLFP